MTDVIRLLPDSVANQIAAGEVIQRPASVVKELVENAVDAGATLIKIILKDAGRTLIQVVDNGSGMSDTDARLAFERHSTSKIKKAADLFELTTMGFRGEALASIAAVAQVELKTMRRGDSIGTRLCINGSKVESQEPEVCTPGSSMSVKNLFFNVPARRKFLKKDSVELSNIVHEFERLALVNPNHELQLIHNDTMMHQLIPGTLKQRIGQLFGKTIEKQLVPVETATSIIKINGFVGLPEGARKRMWLQYFFVNGRNMRHPYFHKAIMSCYEKLIGPDVQPNYFINLEVDPSTIDVNIHPTKNEIKFENEQAIWQILQAAVRESLGKFNVAPAMDFTADEVPEIPAFAPNATINLDLGDKSELYNPFDTPTTGTRNNGINHTAPAAPTVGNNGMRSSALNWKRESGATYDDWDKLYSRWTNGSVDELPQQLSISGNASDGNSSKEMESTEADVTNAIQFKNKYILTPARSGLMIIDQHRAHVKILYERYLNCLKGKLHASQSLIFPEMLTLTTAQEVILNDIKEKLTSCGFEIEKAGKGNWAINGIPAMADTSNGAELLYGIIDNMMNRGGDARQEIESDIALSMAKSSAIKSGQQLTSEAMETLMRDLFMLSTPTYTPDGNLILKIIETETLTRSF
ncbi:MAG: DNA mismatch repair endonuclease MutL [Clostridiales bacterium]|nr:DNA mismatch repair endonuclease MutL [Clostridiales bacterium]